MVKFVMSIARGPTVSALPHLARLKAALGELESGKPSRLGRTKRITT